MLGKQSLLCVAPEATLDTSFSLSKRLILCVPELNYNAKA